MSKAENAIKGSVRNIIDTYKKASEASLAEGEAWYTDAHSIALQVSELCGTIDIRVGAGILAALSPQMDWGENIAEALKLASIGYSKKQTGANNTKAVKIREGQDPEEVLGGKKVVPFYHAILEPFGNDLPVVDRHAIEVFCGKPVSKRDRTRAMSSLKEITEIQASYKLASNKLGVHYNVVQAVTWVQHRKNKGYTKTKAWEQ